MKASFPLSTISSIHLMTVVLDKGTGVQYIKMGQLEGFKSNNSLLSGSGSGERQALPHRLRLRYSQVREKRRQNIEIFCPGNRFDDP
ncbi:hypothetical protein J6590_031942 [Homalodisca vitripennis]|nr:hypothetical protein J6590_031942 [Homalodisca vitripennis]